MSDAAAWYLCGCVDCGKPLKAQGTPPEKPICQICYIVRAAPEDMRAIIRKTLQPVPDDGTTAEPEAPVPEAPVQWVLGSGYRGAA
jgi:hypothetical protein